MALVTALRSAGRGGKVHVELDGAAWRTLPLEVVVRAGLSAGCALDRARLRLLRRELRRHEALEASTAALRHRDLSAQELEARLRRRRVAPAGREEALSTLRCAGLVDDDRVARSRARALADRGYGDAAIRADLERRGIDSAAAEAAVAELAPEHERAAGLVEKRGGGVRTARLLARRGFTEDVVEAAMAVQAGTEEPRALR
ncbi:MAG TPA: RecX family transcriptional regulator [Gaiellaceae bacterium]